MGSLLRSLSAAGNTMEYLQQQNDRHKLVQAQLAQEYANIQNQQEERRMKQQQLDQEQSKLQQEQQALAALLGGQAGAAPQGGQGMPQGALQGMPQGALQGMIPQAAPQSQQGGQGGVGASQVLAALGGAQGVPQVPAQQLQRPQGQPIPPPPGGNSPLVQPMQQPQQAPQIPMGGQGGAPAGQDMITKFKSLPAQTQMQLLRSNVLPAQVKQALIMGSMGGRSGSMDHMAAAKVRLFQTYVANGMDPTQAMAQTDQEIGSIYGQQAPQPTQGGAQGQPGTKPVRIDKPALANQAKTMASWDTTDEKIKELEDELNRADKLNSSGEYKSGPSSPVRGKFDELMAEQGLGGESMKKAGEGAELYKKISANVILDTSILDTLPSNRATNQLRTFIANGKFGDEYLPEVNDKIIQAQKAAIATAKTYRQFYEQYAKNSPNGTWDANAGKAWEALTEQYPFYDFKNNKALPGNVKKAQAALSQYTAKLGAGKNPDEDTSPGSGIPLPKDDTQNNDPFGIR